jgi:hypothetical protein
MSTDRSSQLPEIESFNLAELDVSALDVRLELTSLVPHNLPGCDGNCSSHGFSCGINASCGTNSGCVIHGVI